MKQKFIAAILCLVTFCVASCDKDDNERGSMVAAWPASQGVVSNGVIPEIADVPVFPKSKMDPYKYFSAKLEHVDDSTALLTIEVDGDFNLSTVPSNPFRGNIPIPGLIPGEKIMSLKLSAVESDGSYLSGAYPITVYPKVNQFQMKNLVFRGVGETDFLKYECFVQPNKRGYFYIVIKILEYKTGNIPEVCWVANDFNWDSINNAPSESPFSIIWETSKIPSEMKGVLSPANLLQIILNTPFLPANSFGLTRRELISFNRLINSISNVFCISQNEVTPCVVLKRSGYDDDDIKLTRVFHRMTFTYIPRGSDKMSLFINPAGVFDLYACYGLMHNGITASYPLNTPDIYGLISQFLLSIAPYNANGLSLSVFKDGDHVNFSFDDKEVCVKLIRNTILPLLQNDVYKARLLRSIEEDYDLSYLYGAVDAGIKSINDMLKSTNDLRLGINVNSIDIDDENALHKLWNRYSP